LFFFCAIAQSINIRGKVISSDSDEALAGVSVRVRGTRSTTQTDGKGVFSISAKDENELEFVYLGYESVVVKVNKSETFLNIQLSPSQGALKEVVISSYSREERKSFPGAASVLSAQQINQIPIGSFEQVLQGQVPGVYIGSGSGQPGAAARVNIRGVVTINGSTAPLYIVDNVPVEPTINYGINPSDIESITVLKDATATALYGSRGSNGVIVVTTKRGASGNLRFGYKTQMGVSVKGTKNYQMMNSAQLLQFQEDVGILAPGTWTKDTAPGWDFSDKNPLNAGKTDAQKARNAQILDSLRSINTNWFDVFFRNGKFQEHEVNASGGSEKLRFYSSANYYDQEGLAIRSYLKRYAFRTNLDFNDKRLSANLSVGLSYSKNSGIESESSAANANSFAAAYYAMPYEQPYINGTLYHTGNKASAPNTIYDSRVGADALERLQDATSVSDYIKSLVSSNIQYKITKDLTASTAFGFDFRNVEYWRTILSGTYYGSQQIGGKGFYGEQITHNFQYVSTSGLNYSKEFNEKHRLEVKGLFELNKLRFQQLILSGYGVNPKLNNTPAGVGNGSTTPSSITGSRTRNALLSFIGIGKYTYNNKYILNFNYRYDGSSVVGSENRWTGFYSGGGLWDIKSEEFLRENRFIDGLKLRVSYGKTGSQFPGNFNQYSTYENAKYASTSGIVAANPGNSDYDWEITKQFDIGTDFSVLQGKIKGSFDWYNKISTSLFIDQPLSATSGFPLLRINGGKMRNRGIEGEISGEIFNKKDAYLRIGGNFNYNKNLVVDLGQLNEFVVGSTIVKKGFPFGTQYNVRWAGVDPVTGDAQYYTLDGTITKVYDSSYSVPLSGSYLPPLQGGISSVAKYKQFTLNALFSFTGTYYRLNNEPLFNESVSYLNTNKSVNLFDRWTNKDEITDVQRFDKNSVRRLSSKDIQNASYFRFRNLKLGYNLSQSIVSKLRLSSALIYVQGENLYTWTKWPGFDPEDNNNVASFEYPNPRTFTFGLNVNF